MARNDDFIQPFVACFTFKVLPCIRDSTVMNFLDTNTDMPLRMPMSD